MRVLLTTIILLTASPITHAGESSYDLRFPTLSFDDRYIKCDKYIRKNNEAFIADLKKLLDANNEQNWEDADKLINKFEKESEFLSNPFIRSVYNCSMDYVFNDGNNYFRDLYVDITNITLSIKVAVDDRKVCPADTDDLLAKVKSTIKYIINSTNKAANKSFNPDGANNAPPG